MDVGLLHDGLAYWARREPARIAVAFDDDTSITYGELARWSDAIAARLVRRGVVPQDNVAIVAANSIAWVAAAFGILKAGGVICPFNDRLVRDELVFLAELCAPALIIADEPRLKVLNDGDLGIPLIDVGEFALLRDEPTEGFTPVRASTDALAMILFTSGSTARPKGVMMTHAAYLAKFLEMRMLDADLGPDTRALMPLGLHATPGTAWGILFTAILGGTLHLTRKYDAARSLSTLVSQRINYFIGVPMIYDEISRLPAFAAADMASLTFARVGGASASADVFERWRAKGVVIRQLYGMTEVGGAALIATVEEALRQPNSCGRGLALTTVRIVRADGTDCDPDEPGDVIVRGAGVMAGYWRDPDATAEAMGDGWMRTGDIGRRDAEGYFQFVDRSKEMIKSGGYNVSPAELEAVLMTFEGMVEAVVIAVPDERFGESVCACVHLNSDASFDDILAHCRRSLAGYKMPRYIVPSAAPLPRLANEKFDRRQLKALHANVGRRVLETQSIGR